MSELKDESKIEKVRNCLRKNKIFFEIFAALGLGAMGILISFWQSCISSEQTQLIKKQTKLTKIQTELAQKQFAREEKREKIERTANWGDLRNAIWKILDQYPPSGTESLKLLSKDQQLLFFNKIREILDSQIKNPVLIENKKCLGYWRNAISSSKTSSKILSILDSTKLQDTIIASANSILKDVMYVWQKLILNSDEVSATGGRPETQIEENKK